LGLDVQMGLPLHDLVPPLPTSNISRPFYLGSQSSMDLLKCPGSLSSTSSFLTPQATNRSKSPSPFMTPTFGQSFPLNNDARSDISQDSGEEEEDGEDGEDEDY